MLARESHSAARGRRDEKVSNMVDTLFELLEDVRAQRKKNYSASVQPKDIDIA